MSAKWIRGWLCLAMAAAWGVGSGCDWSGDDDDDDAVNVAGRWFINTIGNVEIVQSGNNIEVVTLDENYTGRVDGNDIAFSAVEEDWTVVYDGVVTGDTMAGTVDYDATDVDPGENVGSWTAERIN